jgi:hypothetical protein
LHIKIINMRWTSLALLAPLVAASPFTSRSADSHPSYDGYHVYSVTPKTAREAQDLEKRFSTYHTHPIRDSLSIAIPPEEIASFNALGLDARLINRDLGNYIRSTDRQVSYSRLHKRGDLPDLSWFDTYHDYADHLTYWDDLVQAFPENSEKFEIGKSYENRSIYAFHLFGDDKEGYGKTEKPAILWHATVHAREVSCHVNSFERILTDILPVDLDNGHRISCVPAY